MTQQVMIECQLVPENPTIPNTVVLTEFEKGDDFFDVTKRLREAIAEKLGVDIVDINTDAIFYRLFTRDLPD